MNYKIVIILLLSVLHIQAQNGKKLGLTKKSTASKTVKNAVAAQIENPFVWLTDINKASALSIKIKKPMLLFFTGSDWCGWCIRLQKEVLKTPEFETWAKKNVVLVELDFPNRTPQSAEIKKQNAEMQQSFQIQGFPTIFFVKTEMKNGKVNFVPLEKMGYVTGGPAAWLAVADEILNKKK